MSTSSFVEFALTGSVGNVHQLLPSVCSVMASSVTANATGQQVVTLAPVTGLASLPCRISPLILLRPTDVEEAMEKMTVKTAERVAVLYGTPAISTDHILRVDGLDWDITSVQTDGNKKLTRLRLRRETP